MRDIMLWTAVFSWLSASSVTLAVSEGVTVVFRYDDPSARTSTEMETKLIGVFRRFNMCCTFAVVPCVCAGDSHDPGPQEYLPLPEEKAQLFASAVREGVLEIAQHGCSHQTNGLQGENYSEFAGLGYEEQLEKIQRGKQFLEGELGLSITTFVPPWNRYDANTLKALEKAGFACLSASMGGPAQAARSLRFLPATGGLSGIQNAVSVAQQSRDPSPVVVVLFHESDFQEANPLRGQVTLDYLSQMLGWLSRERDVRVQPIGRVQHLSKERYVANRRMRYFLPVRLQASPGIYLSETNSALRLVVFYGGILLVVAILTLVVSMLVFRNASVMISRLVLLSALLFPVGVSVWTFHDMQVSVKGLMSVVCGLGYCLGAWSASLLRYCRVRVWGYRV